MKGVLSQVLGNTLKNILPSSGRSNSTLSPIIPPANRRVAIDGHSFGELEWMTGERRLNRGIGFWWQMLANGAVEIPHDRNTSVSGQTSTQILSRIQNTISITSDCGTIFVVPLDVNDRGGANLSAEESIDNIRSYIQTMKGTGKLIVYMMTTPRAGLTLEQQENLITVRDWTRVNLPAIAPGQLILVDVFEQFKVVGTICEPTSDATIDGTHPSPTMADAVARQILSKVSSLYPEYDIISYIKSLGTNLVINSAFSGTGGSHSGSGTFTGVVPDGFIQTHPANTSVTSSVPEAGTYTFSVVKTGTAASAPEFAFRTTGVVNNGDVVRFACKLSAQGGLEQLTEIVSGLRIGSSGTSFIGAEGYRATTAGTLIPTTPYSGIYFSQPLVVSGVSANVDYIVRPAFVGPGQVSISVSDMVLVKV